MAVRSDEAIHPVSSLFGLLCVPFVGWVLEQSTPPVLRQECSCAISLSLDSWKKFTAGHLADIAIHTNSNIASQVNHYGMAIVYAGLVAFLAGN
jgi:hypothetical protein